MMQPSSIDVRLDRFFRVFENHRYPHIDPAADQSDLTREVEPEGDEPFILHPGEFVLGSTYEGDLAARRRRGAGRGQVVAGPAGPAHPRHRRLRRPRLLRPRHPGAGQRGDAADQALPGMKIGQFCFFRLSSPSEHPYGSAKYGSRYQGQRGPTPSRSFQNFHRTPI